MGNNESTAFWGVREESGEEEATKGSRESAAKGKKQRGRVYE